MPSERLLPGGHRYVEHRWDAPGGCGEWHALHGFTGSGADFESLARAVGGSWRALDLPGHGGTPPIPGEDWTPRVARAVAGWVAPGGRLLGYSMGARTALHAALCAPERFQELVLVGVTAGIEGEGEREARRVWDEAWARRAETLSVEAFLEAWYGLPLLSSQARIPDAVRAGMRERRLTHDASGWAASLRGMGSGVMAPVWDRLSELEMPVCVITGEEDVRYAALAERLVEALPRAEHIAVPGAGHSPHMEQVEVVAEVLLRRFA